MKSLKLQLISLLCVLTLCLARNLHSEEIVLVEDILRVNAQPEDNASVALITLKESGELESSEELDVTDDLVLPTHNKSLTPTAASGSEEEGQREEELIKAAAPPIDMSVFVALIPAQAVQEIASNYYRHDAEVQRAYAFLSSSYFAEMKQQLMQLPEVLAFTGYLNASGLDVLKLMQSVIQVSRPLHLELAKEDEVSARPQLNGLHGLVDSILDVLPQDQILATFFDKIESDAQFAKLVNSIGTPKFAKILSNLQNSVPLRNLIFVMHNNSIYIDRIVESLKSYFFLSSF